MNYILVISMALNIYLLTWVIKARKIFKGIKDLNNFVKQEKERTRVLREGLKKAGFEIID